jgi:hypothetical protein
MNHHGVADYTTNQVQSPISSNSAKQPEIHNGIDMLKRKNTSNPHLNARDLVSKCCRRSIFNVSCHKYNTYTTPIQHCDTALRPEKSDVPASLAAIKGDQITTHALL